MGRVIDGVVKDGSAAGNRFNVNFRAVILGGASQVLI